MAEIGMTQVISPNKAEASHIEIVYRSALRGISFTFLSIKKKAELNLVGSL